METVSWFESFLEEYFTFIVKSSWNKIVGRVFYIYSQKNEPVGVI